jgi:hypothetical protein
MSRILAMSLTILVCACATSNPAPRPADTVYPAAQLQEDVAQMRAVLDEGHPALYRYRTRPVVDSALRALGDSARSSMTAVRFWRLATSAVATIRDNHTTIVPSQPVFDVIYRNPGAILPLRFGVIDGRVFVTRSYLQGDSIRDGSEVLSFNGVSAENFLRDCASAVPTDGDVISRPIRKIEREFELTCAIWNGLPRTWVLDVRDAGGAVRAWSVVPRPWRSVTAARRAIAPGDTVRGPAGQLVFTPDSSVATITLTTFSKSDEFNPGTFVKESFAAIRSSRAGAVIIDLRKNGGGRDKYAAHLFAQFAPDTFTYYTSRTIRRGRYSFLRKTDDWLLNYMLWFIPKARNEDGTYRLRMGMDKPMKPARDAWKGPVLMLVDGSSLSTSSELASVFRARKRGLIVGEESGSALGGGTGATVSVVLRKTGLTMNLPLMNAYIAPRPGDEHLMTRGVLPDVLIRPGLSDLLANRDPVLDSALTLARRAIR